MAHHLIRPELRKFVGRGLNIKSRRCLPTVLFCRLRFSDFMAKQEGCEPAAPLAKGPCGRSEMPKRSNGAVSRSVIFSAGGRGVESRFLQRRVIFETEFLAFDWGAN